MRPPVDVDPAGREWSANDHVRRRIGAVRELFRASGAVVRATSKGGHRGLIIRRGGGPTVGSTGLPNEVLLVFHIDHWVAGPNTPDAYLDYVGDQYLPASEVAAAIGDLLR